MNEHFKPSRLKLERAKSKILILQKDIEKWSDKLNISFRTEVPEDALGARLIIASVEPDLPLEEWQLDVAECAHLLRSALDNMVFSLARHIKDPPDAPWDLSFPIFHERNRFDEKLAKLARQLNVDIAADIKDIQPFNRPRPGDNINPKQDPLYVLSILNNADKHQLPPIALLALAKFDFQSTFAFKDAEAAERNTPPNIVNYMDPIKPGQCLFEIFTKDPIKKISGDFKIEVVISITSKDIQWPVNTVMHLMVLFVQNILDHFEDKYVTPQDRLI